MKLVKTSILSSISTFARLASGVISLKFVAVIIGPEGVALVGQFSNFINMVSSVASGAMATGVTSLTAKYSNDDEKKLQLWKNAIFISGCLSSLCGILIIIFNQQLSIIFLHDKKYHFVFILFGLTLILYVWNQLILSILNGLAEIGRMTFINTLNSFISVITSVILVYYYKIFGVLIAVTIVPNVIFFISLLCIYKRKWFRWSIFIGRFNKQRCYDLSNYTIMAIIAAIVTPLQQLLVRNLMIDKISLNMAGNWQGLQGISNAYLMVVYTAFSTYFLPKFAALNSNIEIKHELLKCYKIILPFVSISIVVIYFMRDFIIHVLYSKAFTGMGQLFFWQLVGDFFKTVAWPLGLIFVAKGKAIIIGVNDIVFNILLVILSYVLIQFIPVQATVFSFAIIYFIWFCWLIFLIQRFLHE